MIMDVKGHSLGALLTILVPVYYALCMRAFYALSTPHDYWLLYDS